MESVKYTHSTYMYNTYTDMYLYIDTHTVGYTARKLKYARQFSLEANQLFCNELSSIDFSSLYLNNDINIAYDLFLSKYFSAFNKHFPLKQIKQSKKIRKPYISRDLIIRMKTKNDLFKVFIKTRNPDDYKKFKTFRNKLNSDIRKAEKHYILNMFAANVPSKTKWKHFRKLAGISNKIEQPSQITINGEVLKGKELCNYFNNFFVNIVQQQSPHSHNYTKNGTAIDCFTQITHSAVCKIIDKLNTNAAPGYDCITENSLILVRHIIAEPLRYLINLSFITGLFPKLLQRARVIVLYKAGDPNNVNNYRPI